MLCLSGLQVFAHVDTPRFLSQHEAVDIKVDACQITDLGEYLNVQIPGAGYLLQTGKPMLPVIRKTITLPAGAVVTSVKVQCQHIQLEDVTKQIQPCPAPALSLSSEDESIYHADALYPSSWYDITTTAGREGKEHVLSCTVSCYPVRYSPASSQVVICDGFDISLSYDVPVSPCFTADEYDLVIIAPSAFSAELQPLVEHKNNIGMRTILKTTEEIYATYSGVDQPEQIKYFIKDAIETWGIDYVLLVGGLNSLIKGVGRDDANQGSQDWLVPVRYTNLVTQGGGDADPGYISDLYYADIYDADWNFSRWDTNDDGIFAGWKFGIPRDLLDLDPDVFVGRLACRTAEEVTTMVNKIIAYESAPLDPSWYQKMVLIGGDTFDDTDTTNYYEGELETQRALDYMEGFEGVKIWSSNRESGGPVPEPDDIVPAISEGAGFVYFAGHGSPALWETHWAGGPFDRDKRTEAFVWWYMPKLSNGDKLPVTVVGGCHNSQINISALTFLDWWFTKIAEITGLSFLERPPVNVWFPTPECFSWFLARVPSGGSIATLGNTGIGIGRVGNYGDLDGDGIDDPDCLEALEGYLTTRFFKVVGQDHVENLGEAWAQAITYYLQAFPGMSDQSDCKTVQQWALLGDPSLQMGGYP
jgi:hypothetical protein